MRHGSRFSSARAFLRNARNRPNLHVVLNAQVHRVVINGNTATGVIFKKNDKKYVIDAKREVILSAGAVESPKLLMLSGNGMQYKHSTT
jgi:choline dehydrogenase